jgi:hypothetical protein
MLTVYLSDFIDADGTSTILENFFVGQNQRSMHPFSHFSDVDDTSVIKSIIIVMWEFFLSDFTDV